jgi:hypothetical protein
MLIKLNNHNQNLNNKILNLPLPHTLHSSETVNEPFVQQSQHEIVDNSQILTKQHLQNLTRNLEIDHGEQPTNQSSKLDSYINTLEKECIPRESLQISSDNQLSHP